MEEKEIYFNYLRKIHAISHLDMQIYKPDGVRLLRLTTQKERGLLRDQRRTAAAQFREYIFSVLRDEPGELRQRSILAERGSYFFYAILNCYNHQDYLLFLGPFLLPSGGVPPEDQDLPAYTYDEVMEFASLFSQNMILTLAMNTLACRAAEDSRAPIDVFVRAGSIINVGVR